MPRVGASSASRWTVSRSRESGDRSAAHPPRRPRSPSPPPLRRPGVDRARAPGRPVGPGGRGLSQAGAEAPRCEEAGAMALVGITTWSSTFSSLVRACRGVLGSASATRMPRRGRPSPGRSIRRTGGGTAVRRPPPTVAHEGRDDRVGGVAVAVRGLVRRRRFGARTSAGRSAGSRARTFHPRSTVSVHSVSVRTVVHGVRRRNALLLEPAGVRDDVVRVPHRPHHGRVVEGLDGVQRSSSRSIPVVARPLHEARVAVRTTGRQRRQPLDDGPQALGVVVVFLARWIVEMTKRSSRHPRAGPGARRPLCRLP